MSTPEKITRVQIRIWNLVIESTNLTLDERVLLIKFTEKLETIKDRLRSESNEINRLNEESE